MKILVCDDDKEIVDAIEIYLSQEGYEIAKAYDGEQALGILEKEDILINPQGGFHLTDRKGTQGLVLPYEYKNFKNLCGIQNMIWILQR